MVKLRRSTNVWDAILNGEFRPGSINIEDQTRGHVQFGPPTKEKYSFDVLKTAVQGVAENMRRERYRNGEEDVTDFTPVYKTGMTQKTKSYLPHPKGPIRSKAIRDTRANEIALDVLLGQMAKQGNKI